MCTVLFCPHGGGRGIKRLVTLRGWSRNIHLHTVCLLICVAALVFVCQGSLVCLVKSTSLWLGGCLSISRLCFLLRMTSAFLCFPKCQLQSCALCKIFPKYLRPRRDFMLSPELTKHTSYVQRSIYLFDYRNKLCTVLGYSVCLLKQTVLYFLSNLKTAWSMLSL